MQIGESCDKSISAALFVSCHSCADHHRDDSCRGVFANRVVCAAMLVRCCNRVTVTLNRSHSVKFYLNSVNASHSRSRFNHVLVLVG